MACLPAPSLLSQQLLAGIIGLFIGIVLQCLLLLIRSYRAGVQEAVVARRGQGSTASSGAQQAAPPALDRQTKKMQ